MNIEKLKQIYRDSDKASVVVYIVLRILVIVCLVREMWLGNYANGLLCVVALVGLQAPMLIEKTFKVKMPSGLEISVFVFVFAAEILGEIENFYGNIYFWDTLLHTFNGFLAASVGFSLVNMFSEKVKGVSLSPLFVAIFAFTFSMTIAVCWEFCEFVSDQVILTDGQKDRIVTMISSVELNEQNENKAVIIRNIDHTVLYGQNGEELITIEGGYLELGLIDTIKDMFVNLIGAAVFCVFGYVYLNDQKKFGLVEGFEIKRE